VHQGHDGEHDGPVGLVAAHQPEVLLQPLILPFRESVRLQSVGSREVPGDP
jgi:hypothetical protein